jgi:PAS domain S-box-containing protein
VENIKGLSAGKSGSKTKQPRSSADGARVSGREGSLYRLAIESIQDGLYTLDRDGRFTFVNEVMPRRSGYPKEWFLGRSCLEIVRPEDRERVKQAFRAVSRGEPVAPLELIYESASGAPIWVELHVTPLIDDGRITGALAISSDVTERKRIEEELRLYRTDLESLVAQRTVEVLAANERLQREIEEHRKTEEALKESEEYYRAIFQNTGTAMVIMEEDTTISLVNDESMRFVGYAPQELVGRRKAIEFVARSDLEQIVEYKEIRLIDPTKPPRGYEFKIIDRFGVPKDVHITVALIPGTTKIIGSFIDISERKKMEAALKASEEKYRHIFENVVEGIFRTTPDGTFIEANPPLARILGYDTPRELVSSITDIGGEIYADPGQRDLLKDRLEKDGVVYGLEIQCRRKDGARIWASVNVRLARGDDHKPPFYEGTIVDITERRRIQGDLEQKTVSLEETNAALRVLLKHREADKGELEEKVLQNMKELVFPYLERLKARPDKDRVIVEIVEANINDIFSPFVKNMAVKYASLTPKEIQVADLMKKGKTTKKISQILNLSTRTIDIHRYNIRRKLQINKKRVNLQSYLMTLGER